MSDFVRKAAQQQLLSELSDLRERVTREAQGGPGKLLALQPVGSPAVEVFKVWKMNWNDSCRSWRVKDESWSLTKIHGWNEPGASEFLRCLVWNLRKPAKSCYRGSIWLVLTLPFCQICISTEISSSDPKIPKQIWPIAAMVDADPCVPPSVECQRGKNEDMLPIDNEAPGTLVWDEAKENELYHMFMSWFQHAQL